MDWQAEEKYRAGAGDESGRIMGMSIRCGSKLWSCLVLSRIAATPLEDVSKPAFAKKW
jgi:hypothetical protein